MFFRSSQRIQPTSGKFRDWTYCRKTRNMWPVPFETVNQDVYKRVLQHFRVSIPRRRPEVWATAKWFLLHDIARPHKTSSVKELLPVHQVALLPHTPYSPDMSPCDFSYSHYWNGHSKAIVMLKFRPFFRLWQNRPAAFQKVISRTDSKTSKNSGSDVQMREEASSKVTLSTRI